MNIDPPGLAHFTDGPAPRCLLRRIAAKDTRRAQILADGSTMVGSGETYSTGCDFFGGYSDLDTRYDTD